MAVVADELTQTPSGLTDVFVAMAAQLRQATVQVRGRGPGGGSGVIWQPNGLIITNAHVARGPHAVVTLADGRTFEATVMARDERRDLAALKVGAADLPAATIGDSDALRVGALVLAVGNPLGLTGALTTGVVHASATADGPHGHGWVRADVRLAPGNSGGPLADAAGRVIGINSMIAGGLALAVPSNAVARFLRGTAARPALGVTMRPVHLPLDGKIIFGLLIMDVAAGSPAEAAGLLTGDVLIGTGGALFARPDHLMQMLDALVPGDTLRLAIVRGGQRTNLDAQIGAAEPEEAAAA
ncbi:MAG: trypsin-like peptidase domain-containing protein [Thermomicrobia bacterium]|nr:trypsin-like peptidase domain-containing protein [Thermomicrobia bacterium]MCA1724574.1 trypsin-like peptidase domain-containing protein [Thermomicrobia bacterium]